MAPVLIVPTLGGDHLRTFLESIDIPVRLLVVGNGPVDWLPDDAWLIDLPANLGYPAAVNLGIKCYVAETYWLVANDDVVLAPGDLSRLVERTESGDMGWVGLRDWSVFGITEETIQRVGWLDENFHPAYVEDADYERRCTLAGIPWGFIETESTHVGSVCLQDHRQDNDRSYPRNVRYHLDKWGTGVRGDGGYRTPFDQGGGLADGTQPDLSRLRANAWRHRDGGAGVSR